MKPKPEEYEIKIKWHFLAKDFDKEGTNILKISPTFKEHKSIREPNDNEIDGEVKEFVYDDKENIE